MSKISSIIESKGNSIYSIGPKATVFESLTIMAEKEIGSMLVLENDNLLGIITERDYARKVVLRGRISKETLVEEIMTKEVSIVSPEDSVENCMSLMTNKRNRHLLVMDQGKLVGIVSIGDLVKSIIDHQKFHIEQLENYITTG